MTTANEKFKGVIKLDIRDSKPDWTPFELKQAPTGSPNVLYDDTGIAAWSPYGGRINMPTLQKLAAEGDLKTQAGKFTLSGDGLCIGFDSGEIEAAGALSRD